MIRESGQFQSFDGLDNRKEVMILFQRLGDGLPDHEADKLRARFLGWLLTHSTNGFSRAPVKISPHNAKDAYFAFIAITGVLGVEVEKAAKLLEKWVKVKQASVKPCT